MIQELKRFEFELSNRTSSDSAITLSLPDNSRETAESFKILDKEYVKTLRVRWNPNPDTFTFMVNLDDIRTQTKRALLSDISNFFDPNGWLGPIIIKYKCVLEKTWQLELEWATLLPNDITEEWLSSRGSLKQLEKLQIPRCVLPEKKLEHFQLHLFTDASEQAYAATVYSRFQSSGGSVSAQLPVRETRVAPVKVVSLPRNELPRTWATFVANRVSEIQDILQRNK